MPELRKDPVTGRWVIISTDRQKRPNDFLFERAAIILVDGNTATTMATAGRGAHEIYPPGSSRPLEGWALEGVLEAIANGIDVRGYTYWSLLDNFEWTFGYGPRFGLASVDRTTFARTLKPSARRYAEIIGAHAL